MNTFEAVKISDKIYWVGAIDWELRNFHGYATSRGSTYNAFLIMGEKPILVDTVKKPFLKEMLARIASVVPPEKIRYVISNHSEMDHSGCLPEMIDIIKPEKVYASKAGVQALHDHFHGLGSITEITDAQEITLGDIQLKFFETRMLHWPDSMFTYCINDKVLFSQDGFGMHFATTKMFTDENDFGVVRYETAKYYANILLPYSQFVAKTMEKFLQYKLDIKIVAPDHGPLWRNENIKWVFDSWIKWTRQDYYPVVVIIYDTMWNSTNKMAASIADGVVAEGLEAKVINVTASTRSDVITEMLEAGGLLVGSPTLNQEIFPSLGDTLCYVRGLKPKNFVGQVFSSYGWADAAQKILTEEMKRLGVELVGEPISCRYVPTEEVLAKCRSLGQTVAQALKTKLGK